ncbi:RNA-binding region-containing protein 3 [Lepisosteus oculatus]|uniref:RNA-binding region-containing protein 3 n=1 Tax=Lepisosteus oculatus TaxID=7918 RepID=UPI00073FF79A|nr:PREDICTED: RNA-binding protein 40 [Lepisosteus oculatus]XP_015210918.1 PREDICTED: RNA-binding protein 40 [Lepisosteus oculatus]XP_015210919.1 PREDICTED: RNA-binding protein 40 [Lepisosteus oculatus]
MAYSEDPDRDVVLTKKSKTLIVRHLPSELTRHEKEDLLKYFGATSIRVFSDKGRLKHTAFATFATENASSRALARLHQLKILNHTLVVEFAKDEDSINLLNQQPVSERLDDEAIKDEKDKQSQNIPLIENGIAPSLGLKFQMNPCLKYLYPPPTSGILANITNALISVPKFYVQVLHLMNKMNLPSPFGPITARPPLYEDLVPAPPPPMPPLPPDEPPLPEEEMEFSSEEESEYESEDDETKERMNRLMDLANLPCKRPQRKKVSASRKKPRLKDFLNVPKPDSHSSSVALQPSDVFEQPQSCGQKKIEFHISADVSGILQEGIHQQETDKTEDNDETEETTKVEAVGFGKIYPKPLVTEKEDESGEDEDIPSGFISRRELEKGRISKDEMKNLSVFRNYEPGDPTCRLYVKNVAKQVEEKDLKFIFGRYVDISSDADRNMFDIVLMKEGRMKGQAFIGLPSEKAAGKALKETNGYVLYDKPLVVQFARSARPKQDSKDEKKSHKR